MGWTTYNDRLAFVILMMLAAVLGIFAWLEPAMRRDIFILMGPWGTIVIQYYFRRAPPETTKPNNTTPTEGPKPATPL